MGQQPATGISFKNANIALPDDALITYIKEHTGKMKSLAAADLDFYLTTGRQLLNIGKPFFMEGIGTLLKNKEGKLDFTPGDYLVTKLDEPGGHRNENRNSYDEPPREEPKTNNVRQRQTLLLLLLIAGVVVVGWGGYYLYQRNNYSEQPSGENRATVVPDTPAAKPADTTAATRPATDTTTHNNPSVGTAATLARTDTAKAVVTAPKPPAAAVAPPTSTPTPVVQHDPVPAGAQSLYRFVILRTVNKEHALRRYNQLLGYQLNIRIETKDSSFFKLYFPIAATPQDTTHIRDSIADVYAARVSIEQ